MKRQLRDLKGKYISRSIESNIKYFSELFADDAMYRIRKFNLPDDKNTLGCIIFFDGMVNSSIMNESVIRPLLISQYAENDDMTDYVEKHVLYANEVKKEKDIALILSDVLYGDSILMFDNCEYGLVIDTKGWRTRGISEPNDERVLQGPREGFDEAVLPNIAMLRRKLGTPDLAIENLIAGRKTDTKIYLCYLKSVVDNNTVDKIKTRINEIDIDGILDSNYINELINDRRFTLFKTMGSTERPDIVAAKLLEGRVAVFVDGTPVVLTAPYLFVENFQSDDDYYLNYLVAAIGRIMRYVCFYLSFCLPAFFAALTVFNPQLVPVSFFTAVASSRAGVPFSTFFEILLLTLVFEMLKETGIRMQESVGHALSIVGGLVVGQAAVEAKIISAPVLIITALSGIAGLMVPKLKGAVFYLKIIFLIFASTLGLFGFFVSFTLMHAQLFYIDSFGVQYTSVLSEKDVSNFKDGLIRVPWGRMIKRPTELTHNLIRQKRKSK